MSGIWIDPGRLEGDELARWYLRSPDDIERQRRAAAAQRYQDFFYGPTDVAPDPGFAREAPSPDHDVDPGFSTPLPFTRREVDPGFAWAPAGPNSLGGVGFTSDGHSADAPPLGFPSYGDRTPSADPGATVQDRDAGSSDIAASEPDLAPQPPVQLDGDLKGPPSTTFAAPQSVAAQGKPWTPARGRLSAPLSTPAPPSAAGPRRQPTDGSRPRLDHTIAYGALRAPAPSDQELAELRRQQAAFGAATRKIDLQNSWFAAPVLAAPLAVMGLEGAAGWAARTALPKIEQAPLQFVEREPYLRVGDNWATRAGRRAHAWLEERLAAKPGWDYEPDVPRAGGRPFKPDAGTPPRDPTDSAKRYYLELKPNTPTGRAAAARAVKKYFDATGRPVRPIYYDPKDFM